MKYERLTKKNRMSDAIDDMLKSRYSKSKFAYNTVIKRLAELEDKIENGTLLELPCKVGDTVYELDYNREACCECNYYSTFYGIDCECEKGFDVYPDLNTSKIVCDKHFVEVKPIHFNLAFYERNMRSFNKTWFLTKDEAEKRLEELRGEL